MKMNVVLGLLCMVLVAALGWVGVRQWQERSRPALPPVREEVVVTIIPGWNLRQVAEYLVSKGFATSTADVFALTGEPARDYRPAARSGPHIDLDAPLVTDKEEFVSYEGYVAPETYRVFRDATLVEVIKKLIEQRDQEVSAELRAAAKNSGRTIFEIITMASIIEREVKHDADRATVADILWRRFQRGWALQADSTVHYAVDRSGDVFTTERERDVESPWNTYKYPGLPLGPICNPGLASIRAAVFPQKNEYWYFLSDHDGVVHYGRTLDEHNANRAKYLQ